MIDGSYRLLREIEVLVYENTQLVDSVVIWIGDEGTIEKALRTATRLETFRTDRATAAKLFGQRDDSKVVVSIDGNLRQDAEPTELAFVIAQNGPAAPRQDAEQIDGAPTRPPDPVIPTVARQSVRKIDGRQQVLVTSQEQQVSGFEWDLSKPQAVDVDPTGLIDCDHRMVARMAQSAGEWSGQELARELSQVARRSLSLMPQGALRPASSIIRGRTGGEIDHAVVLAALMRARKIPARVVFGLSPDRENSEENEVRLLTKLSAWVVVSIDGQWFSVDPMTTKLNRADQLCLDAPPGDADLQARLTKVFRQVLDLDIEIRGARYE